MDEIDLYCNTQIIEKHEKQNFRENVSQRFAIFDLNVSCIHSLWDQSYGYYVFTPVMKNNKFLSPNHASILVIISLNTKTNE